MTFAGKVTATAHGLGRAFGWVVYPSSFHTFFLWNGRSDVLSHFPKMDHKRNDIMFLNSRTRSICYSAFVCLIYFSSFDAVSSLGLALK